MKKIMLVFGTRPEAIKMAPLIMEFKQHTEFQTVVCVTGQHKEMLYQVLDIFNITPQYDLHIMKPDQDLYSITSDVLLGMKPILEKEHPDMVLVHGDTTTSIMAALAAFYQQIPVGHVEAGLRTHNIYSPWPEEINRQLTGRIATFHFCPTRLSRENLLKENIVESNIVVTGNTVIDALLWVVNKIKNDTQTEKSVKNSLKQNGYDVMRLINKRRVVLITGHRRENFGEGFLNICNAIKLLAQKYPDTDFIYPMHLNPHVRRPIHEVFGNDLSHLGNIFFIEPQEYLNFVYLMEMSDIVLTDSGGIQEEAPSLGKPVIVMRDTTERPEAVEAGTVRMAGTSKEKIIDEVERLLADKDLYKKMSRATNPYGDGLAAKRIVNYIKEVLS